MVPSKVRIARHRSGKYDTAPAGVLAGGLPEARIIDFIALISRERMSNQSRDIKAEPKCKTVWRCPRERDCVVPWPERVGLFCFPHRTVFESNDEPGKRHAFVLTRGQDGEHTFGLSISTYSPTQDHEYVLCALTRCAMFDAVWAVLDAIRPLFERVPLLNLLDDLVLGIVQRTPLPPPGCRLSVNIKRMAESGISLDLVREETRSPLARGKISVNSSKKEAGAVPQDESGQPSLNGEYEVYDFGAVRDASTIYTDSDDGEYEYKDEIEQDMPKQVENAEDIWACKKKSRYLATGVETLRIRMHTPSTNCLPFVEDTCVECLFSSLSFNHIVSILGCMFLDQRIVMHSTSSARLVMCSEALCALMLPFRWNHTYIPFLNEFGGDFLQSSGAFLIGMSTAAWEQHSQERSIAQSLASAMVVHLDFDKVVAPMSATSIPDLPESVPKDLYRRSAAALMRARTDGVRLKSSTFSASCGELSNSCATYDGFKADRVQIPGNELSDGVAAVFIKKGFQELRCVLPKESLERLASAATCVCSPFSHPGPGAAHSAQCPIQVQSLAKLSKVCNDGGSGKAAAPYVVHHGQSNGESDREELVVSFGSGSLPFCIMPWRAPQGWLSSGLVCQIDSSAEQHCQGTAPVPNDHVIVAINGVPVMNLSFHQTVAALRCARRPMAIRFAHVGTLPLGHLTGSWVDGIRSAFLVTFEDLLGNFTAYLSTSRPTKGQDRGESYLPAWISHKIRLHGSSSAPSRRFDSSSFLLHSPQAHRLYLLALTKAQAFACLVDDMFENGHGTAGRNEDGSSLLERLHGLRKRLPPTTATSRAHGDLLCALVERMSSRLPGSPLLYLTAEYDFCPIEAFLQDNNGHLKAHRSRVATKPLLVYHASFNTNIACDCSALAKAHTFHGGGNFLRRSCKSLGSVGYAD